MADELAAAYRHLGWQPVAGSVADAQTHAFVAVADASIDASTLSEAEEAGARVAPSSHACGTTFDRDALRRKASQELGLPSLEQELVQHPDDLEAAAERVGFPLVVKQRRGSGQVVMERALDVDKLPAPFPEDGLVLERYIAFDYEVTILAARSVDPATGQLATWFCEPIGTRHVDGRLVETWQPAPLSETAMGNARSIAARVTGALECCGLYAIELFVDGEEVYFSQASPLCGLDGMLTRATQRLDQFELQARASLRLPIDVTLVSPGAAQLVHGADATPEAIAAAMAVEEAGVQVIRGPVNAVLVRATGDTVEEARERAAEAAAQFR